MFKTLPLNKFTGKDISGLRFGRLTVRELSHFKIVMVSKNGRSGLTPQRSAYWFCKCDCGNETVVGGSALKQGRTKSCGCLHREAISKAASSHGKSKTPLYHRWVNMMTRCYNPNREFWHCYGGRGIKVCDRWLDFSNFATDMGSTFSPELTLERVDVNGNYEPSNCKWETGKNQARNHRSTLRVEWKGKSISLAELAESESISYYTLRHRILSGIPVDRAIINKRIIRNTNV